MRWVRCVCVHVCVCVCVCVCVFVCICLSVCMCDQYIGCTTIVYYSAHRHCPIHEEKCVHVCTCCYKYSVISYYPLSLCDAAIFLLLS